MAVNDTRKQLLLLMKLSWHV